MSLPALALALLLPTADVTLDGMTLVLPEPILFKTGSAELADGGALAPLLAYLAKRADTTVRIEGHVAEPADGQKLSEQRAMAVARALVAKGVDCKRLVPVGFGANKPVADPKTPEGRAQNTRITVVNAALRGRAIGGMPLDGGGAPAGDPCR